MIIERLAVVDSTNKYILKHIKKREDAIVRADRQTGGMGTKNRTFVSDEGGLYCTKLTFYNSLLARDAFKIMVDASMAVVKTLLSFGINARIKWPNDVYVNGKKICGILINNSLVGDKIDYSIVGIGINVNNKIADEISDIAISMKQILNKDVDIESVFMTLFTNLSFPTPIKTYKNYNLALGKKITVTDQNGSYSALAVDITDDGRLVLENGMALSSAEIKINL